MSQQRKRYLQLAERATKPRDRLFYELMADMAPAVNGMARKQVNQVGGPVVYDVVMRACAACIHELSWNLTSQQGVDQEHLVRNFREALELTASSQQVIGAVPVTPKLDS